jgi:hypothetical protein
MRGLSKNRHAYRPSVNEAALEERVVLSGLTNVRIAVPRDAGLGTPLYALVLRQQVVGSAAQTALVRAAAAHHGTLTARQVRAILLRENRAAAIRLRLAIQNAALQARASSSSPAVQHANFNAMASGAINATALQLSSQASLLPGASARLIPSIQAALLAPTRASLLSRINAVSQSNQFTSPNFALQATIARQVSAAFATTNAQLTTFLNTPAATRTVTSSASQSASLQASMANQSLAEIRNVLSALAQSLPTVANSTLFANGATTTTASSQAAFQAQLNRALQVAAMQIASGVSMFPGASSSVIPQLQATLFGTGTSNTSSMLSGLQNAATTNSNASTMTTAANNVITTGLQNLLTPVARFFGITPQQNELLVTGNLPSIFGPPFGDFAFGFNTGFGSGFPGFGVAPTSFNVNFDSGFFGTVNAANTTFGLTPPNFVGLVPGTATGGFGPETGIIFGSGGTIGTSGLGGIGAGATGFPIPQF